MYVDFNTGFGCLPLRHATEQWHEYVCVPNISWSIYFSHLRLFASQVSTQMEKKTKVTMKRKTYFDDQDSDDNDDDLM